MGISNDPALEAEMVKATSGIADAVFDATGGAIHAPLQEKIEQASQPKSTEAPTAPAEPPAPAAAPAPTAEPPRKIAGKYTSIDEAEKGIFEAGNTISAQARELDELRAFKQAHQPPPAPAAPVADPLDEIERFGVPKEPLKAAIQAAAAQATQQAWDSVLKPLQVKAEADQRITQEVPEYAARNAELNAFLKANPELDREITAAESQATTPDQHYMVRKYAWMHFSQAMGTAREAELQGQANERKQSVEKARVDAVVPKAPTTTTRDTPAKPAAEEWNPERQQQLIDLARAGHPGALWRNTIGTVLAKQYPGTFGPESP